MNDLNKKCEMCNKPLRPSQFARTKLEGKSAVKMGEAPVCRNYPNCPKAEKEV